MSDALGLIHKLSDEQQRIWRSVPVDIERLKIIAGQLEALWDTRRRELAGTDYDFGFFGNSAMHGRLLMRHGRRGAE